MFSLVVNFRTVCIIRRGICWIFLSASEPSTFLPKSDAHGLINYSACMRLFLPIDTPLDKMPVTRGSVVTHA